jgi:hypothetical protein
VPLGEGTSAEPRDRVTFNAHIIETGDQSYRLQKTQEARQNKK